MSLKDKLYYVKLINALMQEEEGLLKVGVAALGWAKEAVNDENAKSYFITCIRLSNLERDDKVTIENFFNEQILLEKYAGDDGNKEA